MADLRDAGIEPGRARLCPAIPTELLVEILRISLDDSSTISTYQSIHNDYYTRLLLLRIVSSQWQTVIDSTPEFWSRINVSSRSELKLMELVFTKSAQGYLDITGDAWSKSDTDHDLFVEKVATQSGRWRSLDLSLNNADHRHRSLLAAPVPSLRSLKLGGAWTWDSSLPDVTAIPPQLEVLKLYGTAPPSWHTFIQPGLRVLELMNVRSDTLTTGLLSEVLQASPSLSRLVLCGCAVLVTPSTQQAIPLPKLSDIQMSGMAASFLLWFLDCVRTSEVKTWERFIFTFTDAEGLSVTTRTAAQLAMWIGSDVTGLKLTCIFLGTTMAEFQWKRPGRADILLRIDTATSTIDGIMEICRAVSSVVQPSASLEFRNWLYFPADVRRALLLEAEECFPNITDLLLGETDSMDWEVTPVALLGHPTSTGRLPFPDLTNLTANTQEIKDEPISSRHPRRWGHDDEVEQIRTLRCRLKETSSETAVQLVTIRWAQDTGVKAPVHVLLPEITPGAALEIQALLPEMDVKVMKWCHSVSIRQSGMQ